MWKIGLVCLIIILVLGICVWNYSLLMQSKEDVDTFTAVVHGAVLKSLNASEITEPYSALLIVREAEAELATASRLSGGDTELSKRTSVNVQKVRNTLMFQERQIRTSLVNDSHHPLVNDTMEGEK